MSAKKAPVENTGDDIKTFVLDTNVLLHNPTALFSFKDNRVVLALAVIEELDHFKRANDELGRNARETIRAIDRLREEGSLGEGVLMENGGTLQVALDKDLREHMAGAGLRAEIPDNQIIAVALA
jgi:PhoH-like ATPase